MNLDVMRYKYTYTQVNTPVQGIRIGFKAQELQVVSNVGVVTEGQYF